VSAETVTEAALSPPGGGTGEAPSPRRQRWILVVVVLVLVAGVVVGVVASSGSPRSSGVADNTAGTSLATVREGPLTSQTQVNATLGYAGSYNVVNQAQGTVTSLPAVGQIVQQGQVLYEVSGKPVVLLIGSVPAYRDLNEGLTGADVAELNFDLVALGDATKSELDPTSDDYSSATAAAVERLQGKLGLTETGSLTLGQAVFLPSGFRVTTIPSSVVVGGPANSGSPILQGTSTSRVVTIDLDAAQQSELKVGDAVTITLPDNSTTPGVVSSVGNVASSSSGSNSGPTITVEVTPTDPSATGELDQAPVEVSITTGSVPNALSVPVTALLALSSGGYAVEVVNGKGVHTLIPVTTGLFDDATGTVQVSGPGLAAGQRVVVPSS
jgi:hypothetical protein